MGKAGIDEDPQAGEGQNFERDQRSSLSSLLHNLWNKDMENMDLLNSFKKMLRQVKSSLLSVV